MQEQQNNTCVFCTRKDQPLLLFETDNLYVTPDKFPLVPGHILIIPKAHMRCYATVPAGITDELDEASTRVRHFLSEMYGSPSLINETGAAGQSVFHAHLHLSPMSNLVIPPSALSQPDMMQIDGWDAVRDYYAHYGHYYYVEFDGQRYLIPSYDSPVMEELRQAVATAIGVTVDHTGIKRVTTSEDVVEVGRRWQRWSCSERGDRSR